MSVVAPAATRAATAATPSFELAKTCRKLGIAFWDLLGARIGGCDAPEILPVANPIRCSSQPG